MTLSARVLRLGTFRSLRRHRNYRLYFAGQVVSVSGTWMQNTAQAWLVLELSHSPSAVGLLAVCQFGPFALLGLFGGALADRFDRRSILLATQSLPILIAGTLAVLAATGRAELWEVYLLATLNGLVQVADMPARQAFTVEMVGRDELPNAIALNSSIFNLSRIVGPGIAGLIIGWQGVAACFALNAASYVAVLAGLLLMDARTLYGRDRDRRGPVLRGIGEGVGFALTTPSIRLVLLMLLAVGTVAINFNVALPVLVSVTLEGGPQTLGLLSACFGAGALLGALVNASLPGGDLRVLIAGCAGLGAVELALGPQTGTGAAAVLLAVGGVAFTTYTANSNALVQLAVPDRLRGRVVGLYAYVFLGTSPVGGYLTGALAARGGTALYFGVAGATALLAGAAGAAWRWRHGEPLRRPRRGAPGGGRMAPRDTAEAAA